MFSFALLSAAATVLLANVSGVSAQCVSFGNDIGDGGVYYFNLASTAPFSFHGGFVGCMTETATVSLQLPDSSMVSCSGVSTNTENYESVCNINHNQLVAGAYTIFFTLPQNGILFGRAFNIVNTQATQTAVVTPVVTITSIPVDIVTSTSTTSVMNVVTLSPSTVTSPAATSGTLTIKPITHTTSTKTRTVTKITNVPVTSTRTVTKSGKCTSTTSASRVADAARGAPKSTLSSPSTTTTAAKPTKHKGGKRSPPSDSALKLVRRGLLAKRDGPDGPLTTVITSTAPAISTTVAGPASTLTEVNTVEVELTSTVTPTPVTVFSGTVPVTVTEPTMTITSTTRTKVTSTSTVFMTHKAVVTATLPC